MLRFGRNLVILLVLVILESATCNIQKFQQPSNQNFDVFNVLDYGAKGDGTTYDTKVRYDAL